MRLLEAEERVGQSHLLILNCAPSGGKGLRKVLIYVVCLFPPSHNITYMDNLLSSLVGTLSTSDKSGYRAIYPKTHPCLQLDSGPLII